jgi:hypothetical protein
MSKRKSKRIDYLDVGRFVERGRNAQVAIYTVAGHIAATLLTRLTGGFRNFMSKVALVREARREKARRQRAGVHCPWTGLSRSALADLCVPSKANRFRPPVKSIARKKRKDAKRAARLIVFESLVSYLRRFEEAA